MKYILIFMCFLVAFSLPLADFGYYVYPSFTDSIKTFENVLDVTDSWAYKMLSSIVSAFSPQQENLRADLYVFDDNNIFDNILYSESDQFKNVKYAVVLPKSFAKKYRSIQFYASYNVSFYFNPGDFLYNSKFNINDCRLVLCFDDDGNFMHYFTYYKGQSGLTTTEFIKGVSFVNGPNHLYFPLTVYDIDAKVWGSSMSVSVDTSEFPTVYCYKQGSFIDLVNKYSEVIE